MLQAVQWMFSCYLHVICISFPQLSQAQVMGVKSQFIKGKPTWFSTGIFFFFTFYQNHAKWWFNSLVVLHFFVRLQMSRPAEIHFLEMLQRSFWVSVSGVCSPNIRQEARQEGRKTYIITAHVLLHLAVSLGGGISNWQIGGAGAIKDLH